MQKGKIQKMISRFVSLSLLLALVIDESDGVEKTRLRTATYDYYYGPYDGEATFKSDYSTDYGYEPYDEKTTFEKEYNEDKGYEPYADNTKSKSDDSEDYDHEQYNGKGYEPYAENTKSKSDDSEDYDYEQYKGGEFLSEMDDTLDSDESHKKIGAGGIITYIDDDDAVTDSFDEEDPLWGDNVTFFEGLPDMKYKDDYEYGSPSFPDEMKMRGEIGDYFEDVQEIESICDKFLEDFGVSLCQMEGGWRKRNRNGRLLAPIVVQTTSKSSFRRQDYAFKATSAATVCPVHNHFFSKYEYRADKFYEKKIRFLVADPNFDMENLNLAIKALDHFNYCTQDMIDFEFEKHYIHAPLYADMNWMQATYDVMLEAEMSGVDFTKSFTNDGDKSRYKFNTGKHITMIILPDDVDFEGAFGFATLHYGLSVLPSRSMKNRNFVIHEIGHNLGMKHSSSPMGGEYGDDRCIMGTPQKNSCFNGPKSYFLGLYMDYTAIIKKEESCSAVVTLVDIHNHLNQKIRVQRKHAEYYVILVVKIPYDEMVETVYMMYYKNTDIVAITTGGTGVIKKTSGEKLLYSDTSQRVFDLVSMGSIVYGNVLIKRCPSRGVAKVLVSFDPNAPNECESPVEEF